MSWFDVDEAVAEIEAFRRQLDTLLGIGRGMHGLHGLQWLSRDVFQGADLSEEEGAWVLHVDVPGLTSDDIEVNAARGRLGLSGKRTVDPPEGYETYHRERSAFSFDRSIRLPETVDADKVEATLHEGVLTVRMPKRAEDQPRTIHINGH